MTMTVQELRELARAKVERACTVAGRAEQAEARLAVVRQLVQAVRKNIQLVAPEDETRLNNLAMLDRAATLCGGDRQEG